MGNICAGKHQKQQTTQTIDNLVRNTTPFSFIFKGTATIDLIIGSYHCHAAETLIVIVQRDYLDYCPEIRDYADDAQLAIKSITLQAKRVTTIATNKECPYKRVQVCVLPTYASFEEESQLYFSQFQNASREMLNGSTDITIQLSHTSESSNGLHNQTLVAIFLKSLWENIQEGKKWKENKGGPFKRRLSVIVNDLKLLNLVRYEIMKLEDFEIRKQWQQKPY